MWRGDLRSREKRENKKWKKKKHWLLYRLVGCEYGRRLNVSFLAKTDGHLNCNNCGEHWALWERLLRDVMRGTVLCSSSRMCCVQLYFQPTGFSSPTHRSDPGSGAIVYTCFITPCTLPHWHSHKPTCHHLHAHERTRMHTDTLKQTHTPNAACRGTKRWQKNKHFLMLIDLKLTDLCVSLACKSVTSHITQSVGQKEQRVRSRLGLGVSRPSIYCDLICIKSK